jgi:uncharacterized cupin superfamily protein
LTGSVPATSGHDLADLQLRSTGPRKAATAGKPVESELELYNDGRVEIGVWECTPGEFPSVKDGISEEMLFLSGDATIIGDDGTKHEASPGALIVTPDGWKGRWQIRETVRKVYTIWHTGD